MPQHPEVTHPSSTTTGTSSFALAELMARIRAGLRRVATYADPGSSTSAGDPTPAADGLDLDRDAHRVHVGGTELHLTPKEFDLLALLDAERGRVLTRDQLMDDVWDANWFGSPKTLDVNIQRLRKKLQEADAPVTIVTVRGVGFRLETETPEQ